MSRPTKHVTLFLGEDAAHCESGPTIDFSESLSIYSLCGALFVLDLLFPDIADGVVYAWKDENFELFDFIPFGQLGKSQIFSPLRHSAFSQRVASIATGSEHVLFLLDTGRVLSSGSNLSGQCALGREDLNMIQSPMPVSLPQEYDEKIVKISAGESHSLLLTESGLVFSAGSNESGQIGLGSSIRTAHSPTLIKSLSDAQIVSLACGMRHSAFLDQSGYLFTCGSNSYLQCDLEAQQTIPRVIPDLVECVIAEGYEIDDVHASQFSTILVVNNRRALRILGLFAWPGEAPWLNATTPIWSDSSLIQFGGSIRHVSCGVRDSYVTIDGDDGRRTLWRFGDVWPPREITETKGGSSHSVWASPSGPIICLEKKIDSPSE